MFVCLFVFTSLWPNNKQWPPSSNIRHLFFVPTDSPYFELHLNLSTMTTATRECLQTTQITSWQWPVFSPTDEKVKNGQKRWSICYVDDKSRQWYFDFIAEISILLTMIQTYLSKCCEPCCFVTLTFLFKTSFNFLVYISITTLYVIYDWITIIWQ